MQSALKLRTTIVPSVRTAGTTASAFRVRLAAQVRQTLIAVLEEARELILKGCRGIVETIIRFPEITRPACRTRRPEGRIIRGGMLLGSGMFLWFLLLSLLDGKTDLAFLIDRQDLDFYLIFFCEEVMNILYINICDFRNVDETSLTLWQFDECTKVRDAAYDTLNHTANFNGQINSSPLSIKEYTLYYTLAR